MNADNSLFEGHQILNSTSTTLEDDIGQRTSLYDLANMGQTSEKVSTCALKCTPNGLFSVAAKRGH